MGTTRVHYTGACSSDKWRMRKDLQTSTTQHSSGLTLAMCDGTVILSSVLHAEAMMQSPFIFNGGISFTHGVASGDPFDTSVLLWVRAAPAPNTTQPDQSVPICVSFGVWTNAKLSGRPVSRGQAFTSYDVDWTVKVEATGLRPDSQFFYQFSDCANPKSVSLVGKTRTLASPNSTPSLHPSYC